MPKYRITSLEDPGKKYQMKTVWEFKQYVLNIGGESNIPVAYAEYLATRGYPIYTDQPDPLTGGMLSVKTGETPRFNVVRVGQSMASEMDKELEPDAAFRNKNAGKGSYGASEHRPAK